MHTKYREKIILSEKIALTRSTPLTLIYNEKLFCFDLNGWVRIKLFANCTCDHDDTVLCKNFSITLTSMNLKEIYWYK